VGGPEGLAALLQRSHEGTTIRCAFSTLPEEHPIGSLRWPLAHLAALHPNRDSGSRPTSGAPGASEEAGSTRAAGTAARPRAGGPRSGPGASAYWTWLAGRRCLPKQTVSAEADGAHRSGRRIEHGQRTDRSDEPSAKRACETVAEAKLTASSRSLSPEHPRVPGQRKTLGNRHIQLSLPFG
jgi:hypothetical protein